MGWNCALGLMSGLNSKLDFKSVTNLSLNVLNGALYVAPYFALAAGKNYGSNGETVCRLDN